MRTLSKLTLTGLATMTIMGVSGCCRMGSKPVPLKVALQGLASDLRDAGLASRSDAIDGRQDQFEKTIKAAQCFYQQANPAIPVLIKDFSIALQGTITSTGKFMVSGLPSPTGGLEYDISKAEQQTLTVPITFAAVSTLPDVFFAQDLTYFKDLDAKDAGQKEKSALAKAALARKERLEALVAQLIRDYDPRKCDKNPPPPGGGIRQNQ